MAEKSIPTDFNSVQSHLPVIPQRLRDRKNSKGPHPFLLPNDEATLNMLISSGATISTSTILGLLQAYLRRAGEHYRSPFAHREEIAAACDNDLLRPLLESVLGIAALAENIRLIVKAAQAEPDREVAGRLLNLADSHGWTCADNADRLAVQLGELAQDIAG